MSLSVNVRCIKHFPNARVHKAEGPNRGGRRSSHEKRIHNRQSKELQHGDANAMMRRRHGQDRLAGAVPAAAAAAAFASGRRSDVEQAGLERRCLKERQQAV